MTFGDLDLIFTSHDAQNAFSMHRCSKIYFLTKLHLMTFGALDGDVEIMFSGICQDPNFSMERLYIKSTIVIDN